MTPLQYYELQIANGIILPDPQQAIVINKLQVIHDALLEQENNNSSFLHKLSLRKSKPINGIYMYGSVGIGKSFLMNSFYYNLPIESKQRIHFHEFMLEIHEKLQTHQGQKNPLTKIAKELATEIRVLCFDEFMVSNIVDAMLLKGLLQALFEQGICLIATSNTAPDDLYEDGLQRDQFIPAIELIKQYTDVIGLVTHTDYRRDHEVSSKYYHTPINNQTISLLEQQFQHHSRDNVLSTAALEIYGREIDVIKRSKQAVWFEFMVICNIPRSQNDYLELAEKYNTIMISNIPRLTVNDNALVLTFIKLIDILYDAHVRLIVSAAVSVDELYKKGKFTQEFERTRSRLIEMQSEEWQ